MYRLLSVFLLSSAVFSMEAFDCVVVPEGSSFSETLAKIQSHRVMKDVSTQVTSYDPQDSLFKHKVVVRNVAIQKYSSKSMTSDAATETLVNQVFQIEKKLHSEFLNEKQERKILISHKAMKKLMDHSFYGNHMRSLVELADMFFAFRADKSIEGTSEERSYNFIQVCEGLTFYDDGSYVKIKGAKSSGNNLKRDLMIYFKNMNGLK